MLLADWQRLAAAGPGMLALQIVFQGLGAGLVAVLAFSRAAAISARMSISNSTGPVLC